MICPIITDYVLQRLSILIVVFELEPCVGAGWVSQRTTLQHSYSEKQKLNDDDSTEFLNWNTNLFLLHRTDHEIITGHLTVHRLF